MIAPTDGSFTDTADPLFRFGDGIVT